MLVQTTYNVKFDENTSLREARKIIDKHISNVEEFSGRLNLASESPELNRKVSRDKELDIV